MDHIPKKCDVPAANPSTDVTRCVGGAEWYPERARLFHEKCEKTKIDIAINKEDVMMLVWCLMSVAISRGR